MSRVSVLALSLQLCLLAALAGAQQNVLPLQCLYSPISSARSIAYAPNGKLIAFGGQGGLQIFSAPGGTFIRSIPTSVNNVSSVVFTPDSTSVAVCSTWVIPWLGTYVSTVELWNVSTGAMIRSFPSKLPAIFAIAISPDGKTLADAGSTAGGYAENGGALESWDIASGKPLTTYTATDFDIVESIAFSPNGKALAGGGGSFSGPVLELWNVGTAAPAISLPTASNVDVAVAFSPDGKTLADAGSTENPQTGVYGGLLELWSVSSGAQINALPTPDMNMNSLAYSPDGKTVVEGGYGSVNSSAVAVLESWNVASGKVTTSYGTMDIDGVSSIAFSPDGKTLVDAGNGISGAQFEIWGVQTGALLASPSLTLVESVSSLAFSPDGKTLAVSPQLSLWNTVTGTLDTILGNDFFGVLQFSPDGATLACASGKTIELWTVASGKLASTLQSTSDNGIASIAYSRDGKELVAGGVYTNTTTNAKNVVIEVWSVATGKVAATFKSAATKLGGMAVSPDGTLVADGGYAGQNYDGKPVLEFWSVATGKVTSLPTGITGGIVALAISPDGKTVAASGLISSPTLEVWSLGGLQKLATLTLPDQASSLAFTPDGKVIFAPGLTSVNAIGTIPYAALTGYPQYNDWYASSLTVSKDGRLLAFNPYLYPNYAGFAVTLNPYYGYVPVAQVAVSPAKLLGGVGSTGTVTLLTAAPALGNIVSLFSSSPSAVVPAFVTLPAGTKQIKFPITTSAVPNGNLVTITATSFGAKATTPLSITSLHKLALASDNLLGGAWTTATLTLTGAAPPGGATIKLSSSSSSVTLPASVSIAEGASTATVTVKTVPLAANTPVNISAVLEDVTLISPLTVRASVLTEVTLSRYSVVGGSTIGVTGKVVLNNAAPAGGFTVALASSNAAAAIPATVSIPAGGTTASFTITHSVVAAGQSAVIEGSLNGIEKTATLAVTPLQIGSLVLSPTSVVGGKGVTGTVHLLSTVVNAVTVRLATSSSSAPVPATMTIAAGRSTGTFSISTKTVTSTTTATIKVTLAASTQSATLTVKP